ILKALSELKDAHKEKDMAKIETATAALNTAWQAASEEMYKAAQDANTGSAPNGATADGGQGQAGEKKDGEVKDVDFEEVKDDKK
ncbi:MAG TPA: molecular chaperone DnaK, partial [Bacteroidia bacterium]|nr:molecular chaperone DnaK [Bacteroidia bacterium]